MGSSTERMTGDSETRRKQLSASMARIAQHIQELKIKYSALEQEYGKAKPPQHHANAQSR